MLRVTRLLAPLPVKVLGKDEEGSVTDRLDGWVVGYPLNWPGWNLKRLLTQKRPSSHATTKPFVLEEG